MIKKNLGGDRLGSGQRMQAALHNYERSTHDLGNVWRSSMAPGILVPFYKKICQNGDTWSINLAELVRTMPAIGPLFGSYKLQLDVFECPIRLYNGILHNNMTKIGMDMAKVKLPTMTLSTEVFNEAYISASESEKRQISASALWHFLGQKGLAKAVFGDSKMQTTSITRELQCVPLLAYYDIFKNYYSNKQEENAYVITNEVNYIQNKIEITEYKTQWLNPGAWGRGEVTWLFNHSADVTDNTVVPKEALSWNMMANKPELKNYMYVDRGLQIAITFAGTINKAPIYLLVGDENDQAMTDRVEIDGVNASAEIINNTLLITILDRNDCIPSGRDPYTAYVRGIEFQPRSNRQTTTKMQPFKLENIDRARVEILRNTELNVNFNVNEHLDFYPYLANFETDSHENSGCKNPMQGLVVKTYQSDIFNNWLSQNWIDGVNGISEMSAVAVENGKVKIDAINLAKKVYNMLNRVAVSGGTYEDWQEAIYGEDAVRKAESPIYCGGASGIIAFEEVVSTSDTNTTSSGDQPLGSLAGKGMLGNVKGGNIEIHIKEPSYVMCIVSITPLLDYSQGNDFDNTEIMSINDLHKPELDEIGFQDLLLERAAWFGTTYDIENQTLTQHSGGKLPAWIEYMTSVNQIHGDFAEHEKLGYMVLDRNYQEGWGTYNQNKLDNTSPLKTIPIKDWTTYIDPSKYDYQFANTNVDAQNFWVQIGINAIVRRKISAKLIPNL